MKGIPKDKSEAKDYVISTVNVEPISEGATVSWTNETNVGVELVLNYIDKTHKEQEVRFDATETKSENITNLAIEKPVDITIYAVNKEDGNQSASQTVTITPLLTQPADQRADEEKDAELIALAGDGEREKAEQFFRALEQTAGGGESG